jgi:hypothetical protein
MNWTNPLGGGGSNEQGHSYFLDLATGSSESVLERPNKFQPVFTMVNVVSFFALKSSEWNKVLFTSNEHNRNSSCNIHERSCNNFMITFSPKQNCLRKQTSLIAYTSYQLLYGQEPMSPSSMRGKCNLVMDFNDPKDWADIPTLGHIFSKSHVNGFEKPRNILHHSSCEGYFAYQCSLLGREGRTRI